MVAVGDFLGFAMCFASSYAGAFFQLMMVMMGVLGLCSFIVACRVGGVGFMLVYFHVCSFCVMFLFCFSNCFFFFGISVLGCY
jgi:hypothetical protein